MAPAVRAIIQFPYRGANGEKPGVLLALQHHPRQGYSYVLPGGSLEPRDTSRRSRLQKELEEELGLRVSRRNMILLYDYTSPARTNYIYLITNIDGGQFRIDGNEVKGIGVFGASSRIPDELLTSHVARLPQDFYRNFPQWANDVRRELVLPTGYFNPSALQRDIQVGLIPSGTIDWDTQRKNWSSWEAEVKRNRGVPPVNRN